jgi:hypothetical protein
MLKLIYTLTYELVRMLNFSTLHEELLLRGRNHRLAGILVEQTGARALVVIFNALEPDWVEGQPRVRAHCILRKQKGALCFDVYFEVVNFELFLRDQVVALNLMLFSANIPKFPKLFRLELEKLDFAVHQTAQCLYQLINEVRVSPVDRELRLEHKLLGVSVKNWGARVVVNGIPEQTSTKLVWKIVDEVEA